MDLTSDSWLDRLKSAEPNDPHWRRLKDIYEPWILRWLAREPELGDEADDIAQEVMVFLVRELPNFRRQRAGSFRRWLSEILLNRVRAHWRQRKRQPRTGLDGEAGEIFAEQLADPASALSQQWDREHDQFVLQRLMATVQHDFTQTTWEAFHRCTIGGESPTAVAADLGITANAVLTGKSRILRRLREEASGLID
ncbi:MAG TPA: sigma-70 family RNA polymerase sigma factor [Pirellulales bacterium]|nr:sigma-70 family RNA polymerase sigma factor [Pirellulales bacterium]